MTKCSGIARAQGDLASFNGVKPSFGPLHFTGDVFHVVRLLIPSTMATPTCV